MAVVDWALLYFEQLGWSPVLVGAGGSGKKPDPNWANQEVDVDWIRRVFVDPVNVGVRLGETSNHLADIDLDCTAAIEFAPFFLPPTPWKFGRKSRPASHWLYTCEGKAKPFAFPFAEGEEVVDSDTGQRKKERMVVELRATGCQTVFPPSVHKTGETVEWVGDPDPNVPPPTIAHEDLLRAVARVTLASILHMYFPGQGHNARLALAGWLARSGWDEGEAIAFVTSLMTVRGHGEDDVVSLVHDTFRRLKQPEEGKAVMGFPKLVELMGMTQQQAAKLRVYQQLAAPKLFIDGGMGEPPDALATQNFKKTDLGNGERFSRRYRGSFVYAPSERQWYFWEKNKWTRDNLGRAQLAAKEMFREMQRDVAAVVDSDGEQQPRGLANWAYQCESITRTTAALRAAGAEMAMATDKFDADPWVLNVENGILNLRTGVLDAHDPQMFCAKLAPVAFDPSAQCPRFLQFMDEIFPQAETRDYVQRLLGYALTGDVSEHVFPVFWGTGANGKTTLVEAIRRLMGTYATTVPSEELIVSSSPRHEAALARLVGARFVSSSESEQGRRLAEGKVKAVTGGDTIPVRFMFGDYFDLKPTHKLFLMTNHRPQIVGQDEGIWRRVVLVPFVTHIPHDKRDRTLHAALFAERSGILNWLLDGTRAWLANGLGALPQQAREATAQYRDEEDVFGMFLEEKCDLGTEYDVESGRLIGAVTAWYERLKEPPPKLRGLSSVLRARGFVSGKNSRGARVWRGLKLKAMNGTHHVAAETPADTAGEKPTAASAGDDDTVPGRTRVH